MVLPRAFTAATPVGASTTQRFEVRSTIYRRNVVLPVPAFPVRNRETEVSSTYFSARSNCRSRMIVSMV